MSDSRQQVALFIGVLGPLVVRCGDEEMRLNAPKLRQLLALLALQPGSVVERDDIVDLLWPTNPPPTCLNLVHTYIARLRKVLGRPTSCATSVIERAGRGYRLRVSSVECDVLEFTSRLGTAATASGEEERAVALLAALRCWRGPVAADLGGDFSHAASTALTAHRVDAAVAFADIQLASNRPTQVVVELRDLVVDNPMHEGLHARFALALAASGRQAAALEVLNDLSHRLRNELGIDPSEEMQTAQLTILRSNPPSAEQAASATLQHGPGVTPKQLPRDTPNFIGRAADLAVLDDLLATLSDNQQALIFISGSPGVGKTSLAVHWAHRIRSRFNDGQLHVDLLGYAEEKSLDPITVLSRFLRSLGMAPDLIPTDVAEAAAMYRSVLANKHVLILLDNALNADQVRPLLPGGTGCVVVVTSRDRLDSLLTLDGAHWTPLAPFSPDESSTLLTAVLGAARVEAESAASAELAEVCGHLPLALRIVATNLRLRPHQSLKDHVTALTCGDTLSVLAGRGDRTVAVRHSLDLSFRTWSAMTQQVLCLLALAPGPDVSLDAVAALAGCTSRQAADALDQLTAQHLVEHHEPDRYAVRDLVRLYANAKLKELYTPHYRLSAIGRLSDWYLRKADQLANLAYANLLRLPTTQRNGGTANENTDATAALAWAHGEVGNIVAFVRHAEEHGPVAAAWELADALRGFFYLRASALEWNAVAETALRAAERDGDSCARASAHLGLGTAHLRFGRDHQALAHFRVALGLARQVGWTAAEVGLLNNISTINRLLGRPRAAQQHARAALHLKQSQNLSAGTGMILSNLAYLDWQLGELAMAMKNYRIAAETCAREGAHLGHGLALMGLGDVLCAVGRPDEGEEHLRSALAEMRRSGHRTDSAYGLCSLSRVYHAKGMSDAALAVARKALNYLKPGDAHRIRPYAFNAIAKALSLAGNLEAAADLHARALDLASASSDRYVLVESLLGIANCAPDAAKVTAAAEQALAISRECGYRILEGLALSAMANLDTEDAAELTRQAESIFTASGFVL